MIQLITRSQEAIQALHERIWKVVRRVMESAGKSVGDSLEIALHLVDMLPSIPLQLTFNTVTAKLPRFTPEALTYASPLSTNLDAMTVLGEERLKGAHGAEEKVMQATWHVTATDEGFAKVTMIGNEGGNDHNCPGTSLSPAVCASTFSDWHAIGYQTPCSLSCSPSHSPSQNRHSRARDQGHILPIPVCRVLAARAQPSQSPTPGHLGVILTIWSATALVPLTSSS